MDHSRASRSVSLSPAGDIPSSDAIREAGIALSSGSGWSTESELLLVAVEVGDGGREEGNNSER